MERRFYVPENQHYSIVDSVLDSLRFTLFHTLIRDQKGHLVSISSFVDPYGRVMGWHDFGHLEGPGWAANAIGGAWEIYIWGSLLKNSAWMADAIDILDHILECGFIEEDSGFIKGYKDTLTGTFYLNYKHNSNWFCPGSMARMAYQLLRFAQTIPEDRRAKRLTQLAVRTARWLEANVPSTPNGWYPRRLTPDGKIYMRSAEGGDDPLWQTSGDSLFILQLFTALTEANLADYRSTIREKAKVFMRAGGIFGSINHDTYDAHENVAYAVAFRTLLKASKLLHDRRLYQFAYDVCLKGLDQFKICEDRNGVSTKGLLFMERSWDTAYMWENAEAALAYFEAAYEKREYAPEQAREYELDGLTILRAIAKHHYGPYGFLTEGVDWNNHVGQQHHIDGALYGAIQYTEPFLNNQHIAEATWYYLTHLSKAELKHGSYCFVDCESNILLKLPHGLEPVNL